MQLKQNKRLLFRQSNTPENLGTSFGGLLKGDLASRKAVSDLHDWRAAGPFLGLFCFMRVAGERP
jgi:hypothetical protein